MSPGSWAGASGGSHTGALKIGVSMSKKRAQVQPRPRPARRPVRRSRLPAWVLPVTMTVVAVAIIFVLVVLLASRGGSPQTSGVPSSSATGQQVDGIQCQTQEQVLYHIHAHLAIFANGQPRTVPPGIGIPNAQTVDTVDGPFVVRGSCFYWLHSHAADGVVHVESPVQRTYTLGNWFDIWGQPLSTTRVGGDTGTVIAYVNGQRYQGDPRGIPLTAHAVIQLDVGTDVSPQPYNFPTGY
jgi:hypothetical protein